MTFSSPAKQELHTDILAAADLVVADSISQCVERGEIHQALRAQAVAQPTILELGDVIAGDCAGRTSDDQLTVADLTGVRGAGHTDSEGCVRRDRLTGPSTPMQP